MLLLFFQYLSLTFSALLPLINPLGSALVFFGLVGIAPSEVYHRLARKIAITTIIFLLVVDLAGAAILSFFSISLAVVQVAGGLVVAAMGWRLLNEQEAGSREGVSAAATDRRSLDEKVFYPFSFPITAGPGTLVVTLTLSAHATQKNLLATGIAHSGIMAGVVLLCIGVYFSYAYAPAITTRISRQTIHGVIRVIAFILLCIGAQIAWNGAEQLLRSVLKS
ncbi:MAG TPA: MarC family protein [Candidatus Angelobacter sp.]|nr:MarC family protein [Candidatus Angelobacter sp.]